MKQNVSNSKVEMSVYERIAVRVSTSFLIGLKGLFNCQMQTGDWTLTSSVLIQLACPMSFLETEGHVWWFFLYAPKPSMVLDTKSMACIYLLNRCQPGPEGKCWSGERSFPLFKCIMGSCLWKAFDHFPSDAGNFVYRKMLQLQPGEVDSFKGTNWVTEG